MKAKLHIKGKPDDILSMRSNSDLTSGLMVESEERKEDGSVVWTLKIVNTEVRELLKRLSRKTPLLKYHLTTVYDNKKHFGS